MENELFIQSPTREIYEQNQQDIHEDSLVFIEDTKEIIAKNKSYKTLPDGGNEGQTLIKTEDGFEWQDAPSGLPENGEKGQVLTKTESGVEWKNTSESGNSLFEKGNAENSVIQKDSGLDDTTYNEARGQDSTVVGSVNTTNNYAEFACGYGNNSKTGNTDTDRTIFTVGNGQNRGDGDGSVIRHNAVEVRKNGDFYIVDTDSSIADYSKPMIKLQDQFKKIKYFEGVNTTTNISSIPISKQLCIVNTLESNSLGLDGTIEAGRELQIIINNTGSNNIIIAIPSIFKSNKLDNLEIEAGKYGEVNIISDGTNLYLRAV